RRRVARGRGRPTARGRRCRRGGAASGARVGAGRGVGGAAGPYGAVPLSERARAALMRVVTTALNIPGPFAAARLRELGATVTKVEPPRGDPLAPVASDWYEELVTGQDVVRRDLKQETIDDLLGEADLLLTSQRGTALARMGLAWETLHERHPRLSQVAIVGEGERAGHDLTYLAGHGLLDPPRLPRTVMADLLGADAPAR